MRENWGKHQGRARRQLMLSKNHCFVYCIKSALTKKKQTKTKNTKATNQPKENSKPSTNEWCNS